MTPILCTARSSKTTKFTCPVEPIDVDRWIHLITTDKNAAFVIYLDIAGIFLSGEFQVRLALSGSKDVYGAMHKFLETIVMELSRVRRFDSRLTISTMSPIWDVVLP